MTCNNAARSRPGELFAIWSSEDALQGIDAVAVHGRHQDEEFAGEGMVILGKDRKEQENVQKPRTFSICCANSRVGARTSAWHSITA
eukprot:4264169-Pyramimonas_sp.AAC.2